MACEICGGETHLNAALLRATNKPVCMCGIAAPGPKLPPEFKALHVIDSFYYARADLWASLWKEEEAEPGRVKSLFPPSGNPEPMPDLKWGFRRMKFPIPRAIRHNEAHVKLWEVGAGRLDAEVQYSNDLDVQAHLAGMIGHHAWAVEHAGDVSSSDRAAALEASITVYLSRFTEDARPELLGWTCGTDFRGDDKEKEARHAAWRTKEIELDLWPRIVAELADHPARVWESQKHLLKELHSSLHRPILAAVVNRMRVRGPERSAFRLQQRVSEMPSA